MDLNALWTDSAERVVALPASNGSPKGCRLATLRLLGVRPPYPAITIQHGDPKRLINIGQAKALKERQPILLRLIGRLGRPQQRIVLPPTPASTDSRAVVAKPGRKGKTVKEGLETKVENLKAQSKTLRAKLKKSDQDLDAATDKISDLENLVEEGEHTSRIQQEEYEKRVLRLQERLATELSARLKCQARINDLERPNREAQTAIDQETEDRVEKLTSAVERYKAENRALEMELAGLRSRSRIVSAPSPELVPISHL